MKKLSLSQKLLALILTPLLGLLFFSGSKVLEDIESATDANQILVVVELTAKNSALVHELQKERGLTAGFLGAANAGKDSSKLSAALKNQRTLTDQVLIDRTQFLNSSQASAKDPDIEKLTFEIQDALLTLDNQRNKIDQLQLATSDAIGYYTATNALLLDTPLIAAKKSQSSSKARELLAYYNYLQAKERAGIERAVLSNTFAADRFVGNMYRKFIALMTEQSSYTKTFEKTTHPDNRKLFQDSMRVPAVEEVEQYRTLALNKALTGDFNVAAIDWFGAATKRINQLKLVENHLTEQLIGDSKQTIASAYRNLTITLTITALLIATVIFVGYRISSQIKKQFSTLATAISDALQNKDLVIRAEITSEDELGIIAKRYNEMVDSFSQALKKCLNASEQLSSRTGTTVNAANQNQSALKSQEQETQQIASAIVQVASSAEEIAANTISAAQTTSDVGKIASSGSQLVNTTVITIDQLGTEIKTANEFVTQVRERSSNITSLLEIIKDVADQTNLLALNAAIEAARAGEQGRGFAVVADEVRTLAQKTQDSTSQIENTIRLFQDSSSKASDAMQACVKESEAALNNTKLLKQSLLEIDSQVVKLTDTTQLIACAAGQQVTSTEEISNNIISINSNAQLATHSSDQVLRDNTENATLAEDLKNLIRSFRLN